MVGHTPPAIAATNSMALNQNQLVACGLLLLTSGLLMAGDKTIDGGPGDDVLIINYPGISSLADFTDATLWLAQLGGAKYCKTKIRRKERNDDYED